MSAKTVTARYRDLGCDCDCGCDNQSAPLNGTDRDGQCEDCAQGVHEGHWVAEDD